MTARDCTVWFLRFAVAVFVLWDIAAYQFGGVGATESRIVYRWASDPRIATAVVLLIGILVGHLLFPQYLYPPR